MERRILILSASVGSGHNMAAAALEASLRNRLNVGTVLTLDVLESASDLYRSFYSDAYFGLVEAVPWLVGWGYDANNPPFKLGSSISLWDRINTTSTVKSIQAFDPDIVICTHFLPVRLVALMLSRGLLRARLEVVTTDYDFAGLWLSSTFNHLFVARDETKAVLASMGLPEDRLTVSGIPVRSVLSQSIDRASVLKRFDLRPDVPILLISAGASGGSYTTTIVRQALEMRNEFQAVVVCGRNDQLRSEVAELVRGQADQFRVLGYTTEMAALMRVATLFVGKPGGLSSSECMAVGLPMVLINPIPGQEERNSDFLLEEGAAVRCNYETTVGYKIDGLLDDPNRISRMASSAVRIGKPSASSDIAALVLEDQREPLWISHRAQRSILASTEQGLAPTALATERRICTLVTTRAQRPVGLVTEAELHSISALPRHWRSGGDSDATVSVSAGQLSRLRRHRLDPGLLLTLRHILGHEQAMTFTVRS